MYVLGLSALAHDPAAALLSDTGIAAAIEESKLVRARAVIGIPRAAIQFCLERADIGWRDRLFILLSNLALDATEFFRIPPNRVVELGGQIEI